MTIPPPAREPVGSGTRKRLLPHHILVALRLSSSSAVAFGTHLCPKQSFHPHSRPKLNLCREIGCVSTPPPPQLFLGQIFESDSPTAPAVFKRSSGLSRRVDAVILAPGKHL